MPPTKLLLFGDPRAGTPLMIAAPSVAIDLPLKLLVWEDADTRVWISCNSAAYLLRRHHVPAEYIGTLTAAEDLAASVAST
jgi:uncharacterized protein (DUF302 family)